MIRSGTIWRSYAYIPASTNSLINTVSIDRWRIPAIWRECNGHSHLYVIDISG
ncbi:MAG: hypothetical protein JWR87_2970 [Segetibacter sp.]|jgi:hypothetical protein|nr:hypothetical protein [Segetibacter sp.]